MEVRKIFKMINPTLLYDEIKELVLKQGAELDLNRLDTYSIPTDSSTFTYRGTLTFKIKGQESLRVHLIGTDRGETKLMLDSDDNLFSRDKMKALEKDLDFILGSNES